VTGGPATSEEFVAHFRDRFQRAPATPFVLQAYDATIAILQALDTAADMAADGSLRAERARMADDLRSQPFIGASGIIDFDERGERAGATPGERGLVIYRVANGRFERAE